MATEPLQAAPYSVSTDAPDGPAQIQALALWARLKVVQVYASAAVRTSAFATAGVTATEGMLSWLQDQNRFEYHDGTAWRPLIDKGNTGSQTTDASGDVTITHNLGVTPTVVIVSFEGASGAGRFGEIHTKTSSSFKVRCHNTTAVQVSNPGWIIDWLAFA